MPEISRSKIINHSFHVDNDKAESVIGYDMIIGHDLMVQPGLPSGFKRQFLQWDGAIVHIKEPRCLLGESNLNKCEMHKLVIQTS